MSRKTEDNMGHKFQSKSLPAAIKLRNFRPAFFMTKAFFRLQWEFDFLAERLRPGIYIQIYMYIQIMWVMDGVDGTWK